MYQFCASVTINKFGSCFVVIYGNCSKRRFSVPVIFADKAFLNPLNKILENSYSLLQILTSKLTQMYTRDKCGLWLKKFSGLWFVTRWHLQLEFSVHTDTHTCRNTLTHTHMHTHMQAHTHKYKQTHTHTVTHTQANLENLFCNACQCQFHKCNLALDTVDWTTLHWFLAYRAIGLSIWTLQTFMNNICFEIPVSPIWSGSLRSFVMTDESLEFGHSSQQR